MTQQGKVERLQKPVEPSQPTTFWLRLDDGTHLPVQTAETRVVEGDRVRVEGELNTDRVFIATSVNKVEAVAEGTTQPKKNTKWMAIAGGIVLTALVIWYVSRPDSDEPIPPDPTPGQTVTASLKAVPESYSGTCPTVIKFSGSIRSSEATPVTYRFLRSDGASAQVQTIQFDAPGNRNVETTWQLGGPQLPQFSGWQQIDILSPTQAKSNQASFKISCTSPPKPAPMTLEQNVIYDGPQYQQLSTANRQACETRCQADATCRAYTFDRTNKICRLKTAVGKKTANLCCDSAQKRRFILDGLANPNVVKGRIGVVERGTEPTK
jgi:hypothetical protein